MSREAQDPEKLLQAAQAWWNTEIIDIHPGQIGVRGYAIQDLIGKISFPQMIWLMLRGELPSAGQAALLEAALVAAVDHGPQAPSISIARMSVTCGVELNNAMASAINVLAGIHGGAGQQCMTLYFDVARRMDAGADLVQAVDQALDAFIAEHGKVIPGFGHRFHPIDPRSVKLIPMVEEAAKTGVIEGKFAAIGRQVEAALASRKGKRIPMNIDGATAVIYAELGFSAELGRGLFILSRSVGILAHAWEQSQQGGRIKGPMPPAIPYTYSGPGRRDVPNHPDHRPLSPS